MQFVTHPDSHLMQVTLGEGYPLREGYHTQELSKHYYPSNTLIWTTFGSNKGSVTAQHPKLCSMRTGSFSDHLLRTSIKNGLFGPLWSPLSHVV